MQISLLDHHDSFSHNVREWILAAGSSLELCVIDCDDSEGIAAFIASPQPVILGPGPHAPADALASCALVRACLGKVPILGICLGHQILGSVLGGRVVRSKRPFHGSRRLIRVKDDRDMFRGLPREFWAATYNSLCLTDLGSEVCSMATNEYDEVEAIRYRPAEGGAPAFGLQFHPDSFLSEGSAMLADNWLALCR